MLTNADLLRLSEPLEAVYADTGTSLLINAAGFFDDIKDITPEEWRLRMLAQIGRLTDESIEIIAAATGVAPDMLKKALEDAAQMELKDVDAALANAVKAGKISAPVVGAATDTRVYQTLQALALQAGERLSLVNSTMLNSTLQAYVSAVNIGYAEAAAILNAATAGTVIGIDSIRSAVKKAIKQLGDMGITGYVDSAGRNWTPEAYVNMVVRTTTHNAAIQATVAEAADYGVEVFQVSSHNGARPLCAPYQGKFYTWGSTGGVVHDLDDAPHPYEPISVTSYGEPAGLFGINCGHRPIPFIDGFSMPASTAWELDTPEKQEENARAYRLSQQQREMERAVRAEREKAATYKAAGLDDEYKAAMEKVRAKMADYEGFCDDNGLTPRRERTDIVWYNRRGGISNKGASGAGLKRATQKSLPERRALRESIQKEFSYVDKWDEPVSPIKDEFEKLTVDAQNEAARGMRWALENFRDAEHLPNEVTAIAKSGIWGEFVTGGGKQMLAFSTTLNGNPEIAFATAVHEMTHYVDRMSGNIAGDVYAQALKNLGWRKNSRKAGNMITAMIPEVSERTDSEILAYSVDAYVSGKANDLANEIINVLKQRGILN